MRKIFLAISCMFIFLNVIAQESGDKKQSKRDAKRQRINALIKQEEEGVIAYRKHMLFGLKLTSDGYGGFLELGRARSIRRSMLYQLEITERKHAKEEKQQIFSTTAPLIYGKLNFFYPVKLGVQQQFLFGNKGNKNGVSVTGNIGGGLIAGLLRPYMMEIIDSVGKRRFVDSRDSFYFLGLNGQYYIGGPGLGNGWNNLKVTPGIYVKPSVRFDYGKYNEMINALEVGLIAEFYSKKIPQMALNKEKQFFFSAFVAIEFGKRK
jgi:hypothetical protein